MRFKACRNVASTSALPSSFVQRQTGSMWAWPIKYIAGTLVWPVSIPKDFGGVPRAMAAARITKSFVRIISSDTPVLPGT
jgi:hypothetical protein